MTGRLPSAHHHRNKFLYVYAQQTVFIVGVITITDSALLQKQYFSWTACGDCRSSLNKYSSKYNLYSVNLDLAVAFEKHSYI
jgi:hypothetical protein